jgi:hypothetical protein
MPLPPVRLARALEFALAEDVKNPHIERAAHSVKAGV